MFKTSCFIKKNTPELKKKLEELGYQCFKPFAHSHLDVFDAFLTNEYGNATEQLYSAIQREEWAKELRVDCGTNEDLFLAIAALRDDTDMDQWFVDNYDSKFFTQCNHKEFHYYTILLGNNEEFLGFKDYKDEFHKATVEELIEHFNDK